MCPPFPFWIYLRVGLVDFEVNSKTYTSQSEKHIRFVSFFKTTSPKQSLKNIKWRVNESSPISLTRNLLAQYAACRGITSYVQENSIQQHRVLNMPIRKRTPMLSSIACSWVALHVHALCRRDNCVLIELLQITSAIVSIEVAAHKMTYRRVTPPYACPTHTPSPRK